MRGQSLRQAFEGKAFLSTSLDFFLLKAAGKGLEGQNFVLTQAGQSLTMVLGHDLGSDLHLVEKEQGTFAERWIRAEVTNVQMMAGMGLLGALTGQSFHLFERSLALAAEISGTIVEKVASFPFLSEAFERSVLFVASSNEEIYEKHPQLKEALDQSPWSEKEKRDLLLSAKFTDYDLSSLKSLLSDRAFDFFDYAQKYEILIYLVGKSAEFDFKYFGLSRVLTYLERNLRKMHEQNWQSSESLQVLKKIADLAGRNIAMTYEAFSDLVDSQAFDRLALVGAFSEFLSGIGAHEFWYKNKILQWLRNICFGRRGPEYALDDLRFATKLVERWPSLAKHLLDDFGSLLYDKLIPQSIVSIETELFHFIEETLGLNPGLYQAYMKEGLSFYPHLRSMIDQFFKGEAGAAELKKIAEDKGEDFALGLAERISPLTGNSTVKRDHREFHLEEIMKDGDVSDHVPEVWRGMTETFPITQGSYELREGAQLDSVGELQLMLEQLNGEAGKSDYHDLKSALQIYLSNQQSVEALRNFRLVLYKEISKDGGARDSIQDLQSLDYASLEVLEELLSDPDHIPAIAKKILGQMEIPTLASLPKCSVRNPPQIIDTLSQIWDNQNMSEGKRLVQMANLLATFHEKDVELMVLTVPEGNFAVALRKAQQSLAYAFDLEAVIKTTLDRPLEIIRHLKENYIYQTSSKSELEMRAVKGPAFAFWGLTAGVCTWDDSKIWKDPHFKLFAIIDPSQLLAKGYIQVYEIEIEGKKYLTLPGINPSRELMAQSDASQLYNTLLEKVIKFAKAGDYQAVYIPTDFSVNSNRSGIQKAIRESKYNTVEIPKVEWSENSSFHFTKVFQVWENN